MKTLVAIIATVITLIAAAPSNQFINLGKRPKVEIINGDIVKERAIPYQVFISSFSSSNQRDCSGTLISQRYLLTAARCVNGNMQLYVMMGTNRLDMVAFTTVIMSLYGADIVIHKDYHFNGEVAINDIALVRLPCVLYLSDAIQIAKLPSRADIAKDYVGETARISGWGKTSPSQPDWIFSNILTEADVQIVDDQTCKDAFLYLSDSTLCVNGIKPLSCGDDFGGPLVLDGVQIGIISVINDNCEQPIAFTKITSYLDWIENNSDFTPEHHSNKFQTNPKVGIINGQEAKTNSIPYQVVIMTTVECEDGVKGCGGSLISQSYILTAARCVSNVITLEVILGTTRPDRPQFSSIRLAMYGPEITIHENFHFNGETAVNDIAVVKLPGIFDLTDAIQLVKLPRRADINEDYVGQTARISGFGKTADNQSDYYDTDNLMQADVQIMSNEVCKETIPDFTDSNLCSTGVNGSMACDGDFGGPLVIDGVQIGIISYIVDRCLPGNPTVFTRITSYLDWIQNHTDVVIE